MGDPKVAYAKMSVIAQELENKSKPSEADIRKARRTFDRIKDDLHPSYVRHFSEVIEKSEKNMRS